MTPNDSLHASKCFSNIILGRTGWVGSSDAQSQIGVLSKSAATGGTHTGIKCFKQPTPLMSWLCARARHILTETEIQRETLLTSVSNAEVSRL